MPTRMSVTAAGLAVLLPLVATAQTFRSIDVGVLPGQQSAQATDINNRG